MPTYAYRCTECDHAFDIHQGFADDALTECPVCAGRLRKNFGGVGVVFKGSGFYRNDARDSSGPRSAGSESGSSSSSDTAAAAAPSGEGNASGGSSDGVAAKAPASGSSGGGQPSGPSPSTASSSGGSAPAKASSGA